MSNISSNNSSNSNSSIKDSLLNEEVIDLRQYFNVLNKYKWRILILAITVSIVAAIVTLNMTPIYRSSATLLIEADQAKAVSFEEIVGLDSNRKEYYLTQFEILKSMEISRAVALQLDLKEHEDFKAKESFLSGLKDSIPFMPKKKDTTLSIAEQDEFALQSLVESFSKRLTISPVRKTQLVKISYESSDPKLAALVANTVGETYIDQNLSAKMGVNQKASGWLTDRLSGLKVKLQTSEEKLQLYREEENLVDVEGVLGLVSRELEQTSQQLVISRNDANNLESIMRVINEYGRNNIDMLESMPEITSHSVIQDIKKTLVQAEQKVSELDDVFGHKHPKMISAQAELASVKTSFSTQVRKLVTGIEKELKTNQRNVSALEKALTRIRAEYQVVTRKGNTYRQLNREVETNRHLYDTFLSRSKETEITSDFNSAVARFTDRALTSQKAVKPKKSLIVLLSFIATLGLGIVIAFVVESLNDTLKSASDVENKLSQRMLGLLPLVNTKKDENLLSHYFFDDEDKKFAESVRTIRTSFVLSQFEQKSKIIEVTSSVPGEGKSTSAMNLAFSLGQIEKVLLIDADFRRPSLGKRFGYPPYQPGLSNLIAGSANLTNCIVSDKRSNIDVMAAGPIPSNPQELLSTDLMKTALKMLSTRYDRIIIDTPPISAVGDPLVIAQLVDTIVFVVKSDDTRIGVVQNCIRRLVDINSSIAGVVLNHVDTSKVDHDDYYHGYYDTYSYGDTELAEKMLMAGHDEKIAGSKSAKHVKILKSAS